MQDGSISSFADRLRHLIGDASVAAFARKCGIGESLMRSYLGGSDPGRSNVEKIWRGSGCSLRWLMSGEGPMDDGEKVSEPVRRYAEDEGATDGREILDARDGREYVLLPRYDIRVSAGGGSVIHSEQIVDYYAFNRRWLEDRVGISPNHAGLFEVHGDSMEPDLFDGNLVIADTSKTTVVAEAIYVILLGGELRIKWVKQRHDEMIEIRSSNERHPTELLKPAQAEQLVVIARAKRGIKDWRLP